MVRFTEWMEKRLEEPRVRIGYEIERFILDTKEDLLRAYRIAGVTQRDVAETLEVAEATVSRSLARTHNVTLRTLCGLAVAAGFRPKLKLERLADADMPWRTSELKILARNSAPGSRSRIFIPHEIPDDKSWADRTDQRAA